MTAQALQEEITWPSFLIEAQELSPFGLQHHSDTVEMRDLGHWKALREYIAEIELSEGVVMPIEYEVEAHTRELSRSRSREMER